MKVSCDAIVSEVYTSEKTGVTYYTLVDISNGGLFSMGVDGELVGVKPGSSVKMDGIEVKLRKGMKGGNSINYVSGPIIPK